MLSSLAIVGASAASVHSVLNGCSAAAHDVLIYAGVAIGAGALMLLGAAMSFCLFRNYIQFC
jgi:hypothetical protein